MDGRNNIDHGVRQAFIKPWLGELRAGIQLLPGNTKYQFTWEKKNSSNDWEPAQNSVTVTLDSSIILARLRNIQAQFEASGSVMRAPGTINDPASVAEIEIRSLAGDMMEGFRKTDAKVSFFRNKYDPFATQPDVTSVASQAGNGWASLLHFNAKVESPNSVTFWDKYNWGRRNGSSTVLNPPEEWSSEEL
jgi:hypothetical protein